MWIDLASELRIQWDNGNCDDVMRKLGELDPIVAGFVTARMVLLLNRPSSPICESIPINLALFTSRLEAEAHEIPQPQ